MANILSTGVSGLVAFQRALDTTGHNIANAATPGYSRQRTEFVTRQPQSFGSGWLGNGVDVSTVTRFYDELLGTQTRIASSSYSRLDSYAAKAQTLNNLFADTTTGLNASLQRFTNAVQGVANTPTSVPARQVLLSEATALTGRLQTYATRLNEIEGDINSRVASEAVSITTDAQALARLNQQIISSQSATGQAPNDLLDQRDRLLADLATHVSVSTVRQDDGSVNVFIGKGQPLVLGGNAASIVTTRDPFDTQRLNLAFQTPGGTVELGSTISGGSLGGVLDFRREQLDPARNTLGQIAVGITAAVNAQHREGMDLLGNIGGDMFTVGGVGVQGSSANAGSGTVTATRGAIGALTKSDYIMEFTSGGWAMRDAGTGANVPLSGAGTVGSPFTAAGLAIVVGGTPTVGDRFKVLPTAIAVAGMAVTITDPARVAAAAPIRTTATTTNTGSGQVTPGEVLDATNVALRNTTTIQFLTPTTYSVNNAGSYAYTSGTPINLNGWSVVISGAPSAGDSFVVSNNASGAGDNRNALALADVLGQGVLNGGSDSLNGAVGRFVGGIGVATNQAQANRDAQKIILDDNQTELDSVTGVNLDEEAANLIRYQQAYQAAAQIIRVTQTLFDSLLAATSR
ncbi:MAG: flagellar hook-associated protein FlgK [Steroidobacteraceae bacterium]